MCILTLKHIVTVIILVYNICHESCKSIQNTQTGWSNQADEKLELYR